MTSPRKCPRSFDCQLRISECGIENLKIGDCELKKLNSQS
jgi:hypothetical protein